MSDFFTSFKQRLSAREPRTILLTINVTVFLLFTILKILLATSGGSGTFAAALFWFDNIFSFRTDFSFFLTHPWTIITSIFTHYTFEHIFFNMLMFYFTSEMFVYFFGSRKLVWVYLLGGITGNLLELLAGFLISGGAHPISIIGASGSVMAIFMAVALYKPQLKVKLFGIFEVKIIYLAAFYFLWDFTRIGINDGIAHFAHLGGALIGFLSSRHVQSPSNILNRTDALWKSLTQRKSGLKKPVQGKRPVSDDVYNANKKAKQDRVDAILDKISRHGYEGLTAEEKDFLFNQSNRR
ncbi:MAG: rhomboid family intramembrane serine protease [Flavobacteriia bacterium]|nr:rhomboid family intramembrane serine protease [Flavobacteriia bacterium]OJX37668.1 MAG: hypothetical protein BGO87_11415 [Flavobacteriia bacterium 40-80]